MSKHFFCLFVFLTLNTISAQDYRSINGEGNNVSNKDWGATNSLLKRISPVDYVDGIGVPYLDQQSGKPNPRVVSNSLFAQDELINSEKGLSDFTWAFGQFIEHDLFLIVDDTSEPLNNIIVPQGDEFFEEGAVLPMNRSSIAPGTGTDLNNPRNYENHVTSFLDGSSIYGSTQRASDWVRSFKDGKLKVSDGNLLPWNTLDGEFNSQLVDLFAPEMEDPTESLKHYFIAGDKRANENPLLLAFHTIFVREHNRLCEEIKKINPFLSDELTYQEARRKNIAYIQHITYNEWLPAMGIDIPTYNGYNPELNVQIFNEFAAAAFRFGLSLINTNIVRMSNDGEPIERGFTTVKDAYFNPYIVILSGGIEPFMKGMATQVQQEMDSKVIDDIRNFTIDLPGSPGLDYVSININRGRDRGLPNYNTVRNYFGLPTLPSFYELTENRSEADILTETYGDISNLDPWVGMLAEKHNQESMMGRLVQVILKEQFQLVRDGDRFYYANDPKFTAEEIQDIKRTSLKDIIMRNTSILLMQDEVFKAKDHSSIPNVPKPIPVDLDATLTPTLAHDLIKLNVFSNTPTVLTIQIISMNGSVLKNVEKTIFEGENLLYFSLDEDMPHGVYNVLIYDKKSYNILKFVKG